MQKKLGVSSVKESERDASRITKMLVIVSVLATILRTPFNVMHIVAVRPYINREFDAWWLSFYYLLFEVCYSLLYLNSCINFFVYISVSSNFKRHFIRLFVPCWLEKSPDMQRMHAASKKSGDNNSGSTSVASATEMTDTPINPSL